VLEYSFLTLSLILAVPGVVVWAVRADLRPMIHRMVLASIPFAFTETLFYPDYWKPKFLFDLVEVIGFGIEDVLFVAGLAAFSSTAWAFVTGQRLHPAAGEGRPVRDGLALLAICFALVGVLVVADVPMIYGAPAIMVVMGGGMLIRRPDLVAPSLGGAAITTVVYTGACLALAWLIPGVFELDWNSDRFLNIFVLGIPLEELLYASTAGFVATIFYPFVARLRYGASD
jgi:hypothetical protein